MTKYQQIFNESEKSRLPKVRITHVDAKVIVANMSDKFGLGFVDVDFDSVPKKSIDCFGKAHQSIKKGKIIYLYGKGLNLGTLLHEIAHLLPNGMNHEAPWQRNFRQLVDTYLADPQHFHTINW
jgi:hypothetical protein